MDYLGRRQARLEALYFAAAMKWGLPVFAVKVTFFDGEPLGVRLFMSLDEAEECAKGFEALGLSTTIAEVI